MHSRLLVSTVLVGILLTGAAVSAQSLAPHVPAWERYFDVTWTPFERQGRPWLSGHIVSKWGETATGVKLLVESLDPSGKIVAQRVEWIGGTVPVFSRAYFEVPAPPAAASYRVQVYSFDFPQSARLEAP